MASINSPTGMITARKLDCAGPPFLPSGPNKDMRSRATAVPFPQQADAQPKKTGVRGQKPQCAMPVFPAFSMPQYAWPSFAALAQPQARQQRVFQMMWTECQNEGKIHPESGQPINHATMFCPFCASTGMMCYMIEQLLPEFPPPSPRQPTYMPTYEQVQTLPQTQVAYAHVRPEQQQPSPVQTQMAYAKVASQNAVTQK